MFKKPSNYRINSEDEKYISDIHAAPEYNSNTVSTQNITLNGRQNWKAQRISLDMHNLRNSQTFIIEKTTPKEKKFKQPRSPGGKIASFLNSLFNQASAKKEKTSNFLKDDEIPGGRRKRRSSISHVWRNRSNFNNNSDPKPSIYPSSVSGFRTPPPYSYISKNSHQELHAGYINHPKVPSLSRVDEKKQGISERKDNDWLTNGYSEKFKSLSSKFPEKSKNTWSDQKNPGEKKEFKKFNEDNDDGADSDSSSDLFELKNYDIDSYSCNGLPVYETTNIGGIKKSGHVYGGTTKNVQCYAI